MGCCCSKKNLTKRKAFHQELGAPLLESLNPQLGKNAKVVIMRLVSLKRIASMGTYTESANGFVQFRMMPADEVAGPQHQSSSIIPGTINPVWEPPERFQFVVSDMKKARILLSVYHYDEDKPKENFPIGDAVVRLDTLGLTGEPQMMSFKLVNPTDGQTEGEATLSMLVQTPKEAQSELEEKVYEYQEWGVLSDWVSMAHPGRWSTADGKTFKDDLEATGIPLPEGWEVTATWSIMSGQFDPDGWQYATALDSACWYPQNNNSLFVVRRRTWSRVMKKASTKSGRFSHGKK